MIDYYDNALIMDQLVRNSIKKVAKFIPTMATIPTYVNILFFGSMVGRIAKELNNPPKRPPRWASKSIVSPIEKSREMKTKNPTRQAMVDLIGPNLPSVVQFIIRNATKAPRTPKIAAEAPTVSVF